MLQRKRDLFFWYCSLLGIGCLLYVIARALLVDVTYDEAWTISSFVQSSYSDVLTFKNCDANNHLLNTVAIKLLYSIAPNTLLFARLPNLFAAVLFVFFAFQFCKVLPKPLAYFIYTALLLNPFLLEFFSLARGYGLAMGFCMMALYYLMRFADKPSLPSLVFTLLGLFFLSTSMFSSLHLVVPAIALLFFISTRTNKSRIVYLLLTSLAVIAIAAVLWQPITQLKANNSFYYGGHTNFFNDTIISLAKYFVGTTVVSNLLIAGTAVLMVTAAVVLVYFFTRGSIFSFEKTAVPVLLVASIASVIAQYYALGTLYVTDRTALFFYPLFVTALALLLVEITTPKKLGLFSFALCALLWINFCLQVNISKTQTWFFDAHSSEIVSEIKQDAGNKPCSAQLSWPLRKGLEYYRDRIFPELKLDFKQPLQAIKDADYVIYLNTTIDQVDFQPGYDVLVNYPKDTILSFPTEQLYLFKLKPKPLHANTAAK